jgi:hypothetical protein
VRRPLWALAGLALLGAGLFALAEDIPRWNVIWYVPAWYGYLLLVDAAIFARRGRSFLAGRGRELVSMLFWSLPFWFFFEACNLRLTNWYYVFGFRSPWAGAAMAVLAYITVLPACLFHEELLDAWGVFRRAACRPVRIRPGVLGAVGIFCVLVPLLWPRIAFPLIWFAPIGLEAVSYRMGAPSLLRDVEQGRCGRLLCLLAAGLWAGAVWEAVNSVARCKWIYTVPGFEGSKLFEMPAAGFFGFPVLAVGAFCFFSFVRALPARAWRPAAVLLSIALCAAVEPALVRETVRSMRPLLEELPALDAGAVERLKAAGIPTPERLSRAAAARGVKALSLDAGIAEPTLARAAAEADLAIHKGLGAPRAALLEAAGVDNVAQLALQDPGELEARLAALAASRAEEPPRPAEVRVWVRAARASGGRPAR